MKTKQILTVLVALLCSTSFSYATQKQTTIKTTIFNVNMHCESCKAKFEKNIVFEKGVKDMSVDLDNKTVSITYDTRKNSDEKLIGAFKKMGYEASIKPAGCCPNASKSNCAPGCKDKTKSGSDCAKPNEKKCHGE